ncbi:MAG: hypothetical protein ACO1QR_00115 [Chthoniobacteraceae bacterium]
MNAIKGSLGNEKHGVSLSSANVGQHKQAFLIATNRALLYEGPIGMSAPSRLVVFLVCLLSPWIASADALDDRIAEFTKKLNEQIARLESSKPEDPREQAMRQHSTEQLRALAVQLSRGRMEYLEQILPNLSMPGMGEDIRNATTALAKDLPALLQARTEIELERIDEVLGRVAPACLAADKEADLNPLLKELGALISRNNIQFDPRSQRGTHKVEAALQTVTRWQDYLLQRELGNTESANAILKSMQNQQSMLIPQEKIAERILPASTNPPPEQLQHARALELLASVKSLKDLPAVIDALRKLNPPNNSGQQQFPQLFLVDQVHTGYAALQNGFLGDAFSIAANVSGRVQASNGQLPSWEPEVLRLRGLLLREVIPRILQIEDAPAWEAKEDAAVYLLRLTAHLVATQRYADAARVLGTYRQVAFGYSNPPPEWLLPDIDGLKAAAFGEHLAAAGSMQDAIKSLMEAALTLGRFTPIQAIQVRLEQLETAYPAEAEAAKKALASEQQSKEIQKQLQREMYQSSKPNQPRPIPPQGRQ